MKTFAQHWKETPSLTPMNSEEQAQVWFLKGMAESESRRRAPSSKIETLGYIRHGVLTEAAKCIGCGTFFEELRWAGEFRDEMPVCGRCEKSMEP